MRFKREAKQNLNFIEVLSHVKLAHFRCRKIEMVFFRTFQKIPYVFFWHPLHQTANGIIHQSRRVELSLFSFCLLHVNLVVVSFFGSLRKRIFLKKMLKCIFFIKTENLCFLKINQYICKQISDHFSTQTVVLRFESKFQHFSMDSK